MRRDGCDTVGDVAERMDLAGGDVEGAGRALRQYATDKFGKVVDQHVVATLLSLSEQHNVLALGGKPAKAVRAVSIVRVGSAIEQARAQDGERRRQASAKRDLAGEMHRTVQGLGGGGRGFVERDRVVAARTQSDTEFLARELAAVRLALADVVTIEDLSDRLSSLEKLIVDRLPADQSAAGTS